MINLDAVFFAAYVAAVLGQFSDVRTTEVALATPGFSEANSLAGKIIAKIGISPFYAVKVGALPLFAAGAVAINHTGFAIVIDAGVAAVGFIFGIMNYLKLKKAGVKFSTIFGV